MCCCSCCILEGEGSWLRSRPYTSRREFEGFLPTPNTPTISGPGVGQYGAARRYGWGSSKREHGISMFVRPVVKVKPQVLLYFLASGEPRSERGSASAVVWLRLEDTMWRVFLGVVVLANERVLFKEKGWVGWKDENVI